MPTAAARVTTRTETICKLPDPLGSDPEQTVGRLKSDIREEERREDIAWHETRAIRKEERTYIWVPLFLMTFP